MSRFNMQDMCTRFPLITRTYGKKTNSPFSRYGIECDIGWLAILERLFSKAESIAVQLKASGTAEAALPVLAQVKEKFGLLRVYMDGRTDEINTAVYLAEEESVTACQTCGKPGSMRRDGWLATLCDEHANRREH